MSGTWCVYRSSECEQSRCGRKTATVVFFIANSNRHLHVQNVCPDAGLGCTERNLGAPGLARARTVVDCRPSLRNCYSWRPCCSSFSSHSSPDPRRPLIPCRNRATMPCRCTPTGTMFHTLWPAPAALRRSTPSIPSKGVTLAIYKFVRTHVGASRIPTTDASLCLCRLRLENQVETQYKETLQQACYQERMMQQRYRYYGHKRKAEEMKLENCQELSDRFSARPRSIAVT